MAYQRGQIVGPESRELPARPRHPGGPMSLWRNARVHAKLALIVVIATLGLSWFALLRVADKWDTASTASQAGTTATLSVSAGNLLHETQRERGRSSQFMSSKGTQFRVDLTRQRQETDARLEQFRRFASNYSNRLPANVRVSTGKLRTALDGLGDMRAQVDRLEVEPATVIGAYTSINQQIIDLVAVIAATNGEPTIGARLQAYMAFLTAKETAGQERAQLSNVFITGGYTPGQFITIVSLIAAQEDSLAEFERIARPDVLEPWQQAQATTAFGQVGAYEKKALALPTGGTFGVDPAAWWDAVTIKIDEMKQVEDYQAQTIAASARSVEKSATTAAWAAATIAALVLMLTVGLAVGAARSIARPVQRLTRAATAVADLADSELARVADVDDTDEPQPPPRLAAIDVSAGGEVGELAKAFNRVQTTATLLVERQNIMRHNIGLMFANVAQRTQNLVNRQLAIVDRLEGDEQNKHMLATLYQLDHLSTRLRRSAKNLLVVSGAHDDVRISRPTPLATALRSALSEIEDYQRVNLGSICDATVASPLVADLVVIFAELLENATTFSPPESFVDVYAEMSGDQCQVTIVDHGIGIPQDRLAEENRRLVERERLDLAPTGVLGLFVVGRLARRHELAVELLPTPGGGVTAEVCIPPTLFLSEAAVPVLVGAPAMHTLTIDGASPRGMTTPPLAILPAALTDGFSWFSHSGGNGTLAGRDMPTPRAPQPRAATAEWAPVPDEPTITPRGTVGYPASNATPPDRNERSRDGLVRRVRGAQLPAAALPPAESVEKAATVDQPAVVHPVGEASAARAEMDGFQAAVTRFNGPPPTPQPPPRAGSRSSAGHIPARGVAGVLGPAARPTDRPPATTGGQIEVPRPPNGLPRADRSDRAAGLRARAVAARGQVDTAAIRRDAEAQRAAFDALTTGLAKAAAETSREPGRSPGDHDPTEEIQQ